MNVIRKLSNVFVLGRSGFVRQVQKRRGLRKLLSQISHPTIGFSPGTRPIVETFAWSIEGSRNNLIADSLTRTFVSADLGEVGTIKPATRGFNSVDVVVMDQLDALP